MCGLILLACKWAQTGSTATPRVVHGLRLLLVLLRRSKGFLLSSTPLLLLLRSIIVPVLLHCAAQSFARPDSEDQANGDAIFRYVSSIYTHLFEEVQPYLPAEVALLMQQVWIPALEASWTNLKQKQQVLEMIVR